jgi:enoyl-CoA hydratase/carnithine racemase
MSDTILTEHFDGWMQITLNRPDRLNAFNDEMHVALSAALAEAEKPAVRALLLTGAGRGFCAGQDLEGRDPRKMGGPPDLGHTLRRFTIRWCNAYAAWPNLWSALSMGWRLVRAQISCLAAILSLRPPLQNLCRVSPK